VLGLVVGFAVVCKTGRRVGRADGLGVAWNVGRILGAQLGLGVGLMVGAAVGLCVLVGLAELGWPVGRADTLGKADGQLVG